MPTLGYKDLLTNGLPRRRQMASQPQIEVGLLTGGFDRPYVFGLATALAQKGVHLDVIGGDHVDRPELHDPPRINFLNLRGDQRSEASHFEKICRVLAYYVRLLHYALIAKAKIFHIIWNNKFQFFDRTLLMLYYRVLRKKIIFTAHNINAARRDGKDSILNRVSLKVQYRLASHIFVHTEKMKSELLEEFGVSKNDVTVIPFGINNAVPNTDLIRAEARRRLGLERGHRTILFFGSIRPYKGLQHLVTAFQKIALANDCYRLIIAGEAHRDSQGYLENIQSIISNHSTKNQVMQRIEFIPDEDTELYFKAADVLVLPYTEVFQSGVLFLSYSFGLPVIATDVGSFRDDIVVGKTGYLCRSNDANDLAGKIDCYFESELYGMLESRRKDIQDYANTSNSWDVVGESTRSVYANVLKVSNSTGSL